MMTTIFEQWNMLFHFLLALTFRSIYRTASGIHCFLSGRELETAKKIMYTYIVTIEKALKCRFPEIDFIVRNTAFIDPTMHSLQRPDL
jgi:hypothetical protein